MKPAIQELIIVEGKDDISAVSAAVDAMIIATGGLHSDAATMAHIQALAKHTGCIILTDPDGPGNAIRTRLTHLLPDAKQAHLTNKQARSHKDGSLGIEHAGPKAICTALLQAGATRCEKQIYYTPADLIQWGLSGTADAAQRRRTFSALLGLGDPNAKTLLKRLNHLALPQAAIDTALRACDEEDIHER